MLAFGRPAPAQTVTVALNADIRSINPGVNRDDNTDDFVLLQHVEGLVGYDEGGSVGRCSPRRSTSPRRQDLHLHAAQGREVPQRRR
jgi:ABC-type transport system substrate-binding protein